MNRLNSLPWTQILLFLLLVFAVVNYLKLWSLEVSRFGQFEVRFGEIEARSAVGEVDRPHDLPKPLQSEGAPPEEGIGSGPEALRDILRDQDWWHSFGLPGRDIQSTQPGLDRTPSSALTRKPVELGALSFIRIEVAGPVAELPAFIS